MMKRLLGLLPALFFSFVLNAQEGWEAGPWAGIAYYFGDLNTNYNLSRPGPAGGFAARYNFNDRICLRFGVAGGQISADDALSGNTYERARNLNFQSTILDGSAQLEFNFLPYIHGHRDYFFTPYLLAGVNVTSFNPKTEYEGELVELRPLGTEGQLRGEEYFTTSLGWMYGGGFKIDLSYRLSLNVEIAGRALATDYLDDVSNVYADKSDLRRNRGDLAVALSDRSILLPGVDESQLGRAGVQRGNSKNNDTYFFIGAGILYYFGDLKCPDSGSRKRRR
jgi:opacity protein-like surface antigen